MLQLIDSVELAVIPMEGAAHLAVGHQEGDIKN